MIGREDEIRSYRARARRFSFVVLGALGLIVFWLGYLQVIRGDELRKYSEANRLKKEKLRPFRGMIFDREGKVVVDNRASFDVVVFSQYYPFTTSSNERLASVLNMPLPELTRRLAKARKMPRFISYLLRSDVSKETIAAIEMDSLGFPGVDIEATVRRKYPYGGLSGQLLGYIGEVSERDLKRDKTKQLKRRDTIGKFGLERQYDSLLRGVNGLGYVEVDAMGRRREWEKGERMLGFVMKTDPISGNALQLTLDIDLEMVADQALKDRDVNGSVVAIDPRNGEILVMLNNPTYDPDSLSGREVSSKVWKALSENPFRPLRNRAIQDHYPPGSTFKMIVALAGLSEGVINKHRSTKCHGSFRFGRRSFGCWKTHGEKAMISAIRESCDVYFYKLGLALGIDNIAKYARLFGLGSKTGVRLSGEQPGIVPDTEWKKKNLGEAWYPGETLSVAIGQGYVMSTPIQMAVAFATFANGGFFYRPYLVQKIEGLDGRVMKQNSPELIRKIDLNPKHFETVKEGLYQVVNHKKGTARFARSKIVDISGKTGTSQVRRFKNIKDTKCRDRDLLERHHGWFVGYAPRKNPEIVVAVIGEHACSGSSMSPVVKKVIEAYFLKKQAKEAAKQLANEELLRDKPPVVATEKREEGEL